jgi:hypothetical protein
MSPAAVLREAALRLRREGAAIAGAGRGAIEVDGSPDEGDETAEGGSGTAEDGDLPAGSEPSRRELARLSALPIVWAAYAYHGV